jgi:hypothetical protein
MACRRKRGPDGSDQPPGAPAVEGGRRRTPGGRDTFSPTILSELPDLPPITNAERKLFAACFGPLINIILSEDDDES